MFVELADTLGPDFDVMDWTQTVPGRLVELLDIDAAGLLLADGGSLQLMAASEGHRTALALFQRHDRGPGRDCFSSGEAIVNVDMTDPPDVWPAFARAATDLGFSVAHDVPLRVRSHRIGVIGMFSARGSPLSPDQVAVARAMADMAAIGLAYQQTARDQAQLSEQLQAALHSRVLIEQAKGVLSARAGITMTQAFTLMRSHARRRGEPLSVVAHAVVSGSIDLLALQRAW